MHITLKTPEQLENLPPSTALLYLGEPNNIEKKYTDRLYFQHLDIMPLDLDMLESMGLPESEIEKEKARLCTTKTIELVLDFYSLLDMEKVSNLVISCDWILDLAWPFALGLMVFSGTRISVAMKKLVLEYPTIRPNCEMIITMFDLVLQSGGSLSDAYSQYLASGLVVDDKGNVTHGQW